MLPHAINESKKRKKQACFGDLPVYEIVLRYIDEKGRTRYKAKHLGPEMKLSFRTLANLVSDIENEHLNEVRKTEEGWFQSEATSLSYKAKFSDTGEFIDYVADETPYRSQWIEYDDANS